MGLYAWSFLQQEHLSFAKGLCRRQKQTNSRVGTVCAFSLADSSEFTHTRTIKMGYNECEIIIAAVHMCVCIQRGMESVYSIRSHNH